MFRGGFPDVHFDIKSMLAEGDKVATRVSGSGWAELDGPGDLAGEFSFHFGDETSFRVWRW